MRTKSIFILAIVGIISMACVKHEIIPAPENRVDLKFRFTGNINNTYTEYTQNVDGFTLETNKIKTINPVGFSRAIYYSMVKSSKMNLSLKLLVGEVLWDGTASVDPNVIAFSDLFKKYPNPIYNADAKLVAGNDTTAFDIEYKDNNGNIYKCDPAANNKVEFTSLKQESDKTGDYMLYEAKINATMLRKWMVYSYDNFGVVIDSTELSDSFKIENGDLTGWFKR